MPVAIPVRPAPRYDLASLVQCTTALDEAHSEAENLGQFLSAFSATGQDIVTAQVHYFKLSTDILVARGEAGPASDQERAVCTLSLRPTSTLLTVLPLQDLIKSTQFIKAYFAITRAVAAM